MTEYATMDEIWQIAAVDCRRGDYSNIVNFLEDNQQVGSDMLWVVDQLIRKKTYDWTGLQRRIAVRDLRHKADYSEDNVVTTEPNAVAYSEFELPADFVRMTRDGGVLDHHTYTPSAPIRSPLKWELAALYSIGGYIDFYSINKVTRSLYLMSRSGTPQNLLDSSVNYISNKWLFKVNGDNIEYFDHWGTDGTRLSLLDKQLLIDGVVWRTGMREQWPEWPDFKAAWDMSVQPAYNQEKPVRAILPGGDKRFSRRGSTTGTSGAAWYPFPPPVGGE